MYAPPGSDLRLIYNLPYEYLLVYCTQPIVKIRGIAHAVKMAQRLPALNTRMDIQREIMRTVVLRLYRDLHEREVAIRVARSFFHAETSSDQGTRCYSNSRLCLPSSSSVREARVCEPYGDLWQQQVVAARWTG